MSQCRSCNAPVRFVPSATTGKLMILNADPDPRGRILVRAGKAHVMGGLFDTHHDELRYTDHHATCPDAAKYRKRK